MPKGSSGSGYAKVSHTSPVRNIEGAMWLVISALGFTAHTVLIKIMLEEINPVYGSFIRSFCSLLILSPVLIFGWAKLSTEKFELIFSRSMFGSFGFIFSMFALAPMFALPLAEFNALSFTRSMFVTVFAAFFLKEIVGRLRWSAVFFGFVGVLIMAVPGLIFPWVPSDGGPTINLGSLFAILAAFCFAAAIVLVKNLTKYHKPIELLIWANLLSAIILFIPTVFFWEWPKPDVWGLIALMSITGIAAQFCYIKGMSIGDASFLSPVDYLRLPMAVAADWWLIKTFPGIYTWIGAGVIIGATLFITLRERMKANRN